jgi:hypothetical protein
VSPVLHRFAALPTAALAAVWAAPLAIAVLGGTAIHSHRTRKAHQ